MRNLLLILLFLVSTSVYGQRVTISGTVTDEAGLTLPGATVQVKGTSQGVLTDFEGRYSIEVASANVTLLFSFVGYTPKEVNAAGQTTVNVVMTSDVRGLEEVIVVGYGTQKKLNLTAESTR